MRFGDNTIIFEVFDTPIVGNKANGYLIGLTPEGHNVCRRLLREDVAEEEIAAVDDALLEHLNRGGFFETADRVCTLESAYLHVTQRCNLDCVGCYSADECRNHADDLTLGEIEHILDELSAAGLTSLFISGGEPFLRDDLPTIVRYAKHIGISDVSILTNGTCLKPEILEELVPSVDLISVSFDGCSARSEPHIRRRQLFDILVDAIRMIQQAGIPAHMIPTIHGLNMDDISTYITLARDLGVSMNFSLFSAPASDANRELIPDAEALAELAAHMAGAKGRETIRVSDTPMNSGLTINLGCGANCSGISIGYDGNAYPCHMLHGDGLSIGSFVEQTGSPTPSFDPSVLQRIEVDEIEGCRECDIRYLCGGGCRARAYYETGDVRGMDPYCSMMREYYALVFDRLSGHR